MSGFEPTDIYTMMTFGLVDDVKPWVEENATTNRGAVTKYVLFPAAQFGRLEALTMYLKYGDLSQRNDDQDKTSKKWNLYHYAIKGFQAHYDYLIQHDQQEMDGSLRIKSRQEAVELQLDIIKLLADVGTPRAWEKTEGGLEKDNPPHPSEMALTFEYNFCAGAFLIDIVTLIDNPDAATPGLAKMNISGSQEHRKSFMELMEWAYKREHFKILQLCHERYVSLCSDKLRLKESQLPLFLDSIASRKTEVLEIIFTCMEKQPVPDQIMSKSYTMGGGDPPSRVSAISIACDMCSQGQPDVLNRLLDNKSIARSLTTLSLSELGMTKLPIEVFHEKLVSLSISNNQIHTLPPVSEWACKGLVFLNLSNNLLTELPKDLFMLPKLSTLNAEECRIEVLDNSMWKAPNLKNLHLGKNQLTQIPLGDLGIQPHAVESPMVPESPRQQSTENYVYSALHSFVDIASERDEDFHKTQLGYSLEVLDLSENQFEELPHSLPCLTPVLLTLKLAKNRIADLGHVSDYPTLLKSLDLSGNAATRCIRPTHALPGSQLCMQSTEENSKTCSHTAHHRLINLQYFNLNNNKLDKIILETESPQSVTASNRTPSTDPSLLFPKLQSFAFNNNSLSRLPEGLHRLENLVSLDFSNNRNVKKLPLNLYHLRNLIGMRYKGIGDIEVANLLDNCNNDIGRMLYCLRSTDTDAVPNKSLRLFTIGHYHKGKTTVLRVLRGEKIKRRNSEKESVAGFHKVVGANLENSQIEPELSSTVGIECGSWTCSRTKKGDEPIKFYTWDFAGQEEYYETHQCFLTSRALYLLIWKVTDREKGIEGLGIWLRNLQVRAPCAQVIVVGTHLDELRKQDKHYEKTCEDYRRKIMQDFVAAVSNDRFFPQVKKVVFVGFPESSFFYSNYPKYDELNDAIYDTAMIMEVPRTRDMPPNFHMKMMEEKIPRTYLELEYVISRMVESDKDRSRHTMYSRENFCKIKEVQKIISDPKEVDVAMNFLHNMGTILHFDMQKLDEYYILNPQWWFDGCALVLSPNNVSDLVVAGNAQDSGLLLVEKMNAVFTKKGYKHIVADLILHFLHQHGIIFPITEKVILVPSMIYPTPHVKLFSDQGSFPYCAPHTRDTAATSFTHFLGHTAMANLSSMRSINPEQMTGLVYRRMFLLPPTPSGFWSKFISLCLQKKDFQNIMLSELISPEENGSIRIIRARKDVSKCTIGHYELRWEYWKTGVILYINDLIALSINSLKSDQFADPMERSIISETGNKIDRFHLLDEDDHTLPLGNLYHDVIEVIVPEMEFNIGDTPNKMVSIKILAKALEMIDEVLKGHCEALADNGIYTIGDMCHVVPCPLCFGDQDNRPREPQYDRPAPVWEVPPVPRKLRALTINHPAPVIPANTANPGAVMVFSIDQLIRVSSNTDYIKCPAHGKIQLEYLCPDVIFKDLLNMKLDRRFLEDPPNSDGTPVGAGCFGVVYHKILHTQFHGPKEVAVKEFKSSAMDMDFDAETEVVKTYADMRYELNKLSMLEHEYVVEFIGLLANPWSFILEWAPMMSLAKIKDAHHKEFKHICPVSLYIVLSQVLKGLAYLHAPAVGIIHSDLKLSNILAYSFPPIDHCCCTNKDDRGRCLISLADLGSVQVLVKLGDMGAGVNPTGHNVRDNLGVKRFSPECLMNFDSKLTEKVDIFCLALCLYELMTLREVPSHGVTENEFKTLIKRGWRPSFHSKDPSYPLPFYIFLEQSWEQESSMRPSAAVLDSFLSSITGLTLVNKNQWSLYNNAESMSHLLDSYQLGSNTSITATAVANVPGQPVSLCLGTLQKEENLVKLVDFCQDKDGSRTVLNIKEKKATSFDRVTSLDITSNLTIFAGYQKGQVVVHCHGNQIPHPIEKHECHQPGTNHGTIKYIKFVESENLLVIGFSYGLVHIIKLSMDEFGSGEFIRGVYCNRVTSEHVNCYVACNTGLEIWIGCDKKSIEVWHFPDDTTRWHSKKRCQIHTIQLSHPAYTVPGSAVTKMAIAPDGKSVFAYITDRQNRDAICRIEREKHDKLQFWQCMSDFSCFSVTPTDLLIGTKTGSVILIPLDSIKTQQCFSQSSKHAKFLTAHSGEVNQVFTIEGVVKPTGFVSPYFNTFLGRQSKDIPCQFMVSIGQGSVDFSAHNKRGISNPATIREGCYLSVWFI